MHLARSLALGALLMLCACGSKGDGAVDTGTTTDTARAAADDKPAGDPCRFLTAAEMTAITTDAVSGLIRDEDSCTYRSNPDDGARVVVRIGDADAQMATARRAAGLVSGMGGAVADKGGAGADAAAMLGKAGKAAPAVGDEAIWGPATILYARKGKAYVEVYPPMLHDPATHTGYPAVSAAERRTIVQTVAAKILDRAAAE